MKTLVIDVGGTHVKLLATGQRTPTKLPSGPHLTPALMVAEIVEATASWRYDTVSVGFPGPIVRNAPAREPWNLGPGWIGFNFSKALAHPTRVVNDALMQALGSYTGRKMLFLGLGTGLGSALIQPGALVPMELAHLPYKKGRSYEEYLGDGARKRLGNHAWRSEVAATVELFVAAFEVDYVVLGGGNVRHLKTLPPNTRRGSNSRAFQGGFRLWENPSED